MPAPPPKTTANYQVLKNMPFYVAFLSSLFLAFFAAGSAATYFMVDDAACAQHNARHPEKKIVPWDLIFNALVLAAVVIVGYGLYTMSTDAFNKSLQPYQEHAADEGDESDASLPQGYERSVVDRHVQPLPENRDKKLWRHHFHQALFSSTVLTAALLFLNFSVWPVMDDVLRPSDDDASRPACARAKQDETGFVSGLVTYTKKARAAFWIFYVAVLALTVHIGNAYFDFDAKFIEDQGFNLKTAQDMARNQEKALGIGVKFRSDVGREAQGASQSISALGSDGGAKWRTTAGQRRRRTLAARTLESDGEYGDDEEEEDEDSDFGG